MLHGILRSGAFGQHLALSGQGPRLALLHELLPGAKRVAVLVNPTTAATAEPTARDVAVAGGALGLDVRVFNASTGGEIDALSRLSRAGGLKRCSWVPTRCSIPNARDS